MPADFVLWRELIDYSLPVAMLAATFYLIFRFGRWTAKEIVNPVTKRTVEWLDKSTELADSTMESNRQLVLSTQQMTKTMDAIGTQQSRHATIAEEFKLWVDHPERTPYVTNHKIDKLAWTTRRLAEAKLEILNAVLAVSRQQSPDEHVTKAKGILEDILREKP